MSLHGKKGLGLGKNIEKGDIMTKFWYTLNNLDPNSKLEVKRNKLRSCE